MRFCLSVLSAAQNAVNRAKRIDFVSSHRKNAQRALSERADGVDERHSCGPGSHATAHVR
jgi:hypothetical protein